MKSFLALLAALLSIVVQCGCINGQAGKFIEPTGKLTVRVFDENKQPLEGINVSISFEHYLARTISYNPRYSVLKGDSDKDGLFSAESA